ncbi:alanine racemase [Agaribacterium haliotis]|uniref:alanine racemase n=1 Tax=Agaribacterium haliotis TaxID=2013869 RepID=UPI00117754D5|nr:alanine racemase [Agaribacterium haliotis]
MSTLNINLSAIARNWQRLNDFCAGAECGAVVKADAYGLGVKPVARSLWQQGCRHFFIASVAEGRELRKTLPEAKIYVLGGVLPGEERECLSLAMLPVLVSLEMVRRWSELCPRAPSVLKLDTGMGRLGLDEEELDAFLQQPSQLKRAGVVLVMSHTACADQAEHPLNRAQLDAFVAARKRLLQIDASLKFSFANSAAILLGSEYHFDMVRPGIALFGSNAFIRSPLRFETVVQLLLTIVRLRFINKPCQLGYGATYNAQPGQLIAAASGGYADGLLRSLGNRGQAWLYNKPVPICGRLSMDGALFDVSACSAELEHLSEAEWPELELLGSQQSIDDLALAAGTVAYEILTSLGVRYQRNYQVLDPLSGDNDAG